MFCLHFSRFYCFLVVKFQDILFSFCEIDILLSRIGDVKYFLYFLSKITLHPQIFLI